MKGVSVIICCYNSAARIVNTLKYLSSQQTAATLLWEVIIVNNASTDNTTEIAKSSWTELSASTPLKIVEQPMPGLSFARRKGIQESSYDILIFCDDDNGLQSNYVMTAWEIMNNNLQIGALGGCGMLNVKIPKWLEGLEEFYAIGPQGIRSGDVTDTRGCLYGAGLVIRKSVFDQLNQRHFQSLLSDRTKNTLLSGGDTELTFAIRLIGYRLWYDERLKFEHFISPKRINKWYFTRLMFYMGYGWMALLPYHQILNNNNVKNFHPDWIDVMYVLKKTFSSLLLSFLNALKFRFSESRKKIFNTIFHSGELYFTIKHYGHYKKKAAFFNDIKP